MCSTFLPEILYRYTSSENPQRRMLASVDETTIKVVVGTLILILMAMRLLEPKKKNLPPVRGTLKDTFQAMNSATMPWYVLALGPGIFRLAMPWRTVVMVAEPKAAREVLASARVDKVIKGALVKEYTTIFSRRTTDATQTAKRKTAAPAFSAKRVENSVRSPAFQEVLAKLFKILDKEEPFDPASLMTMTILDILGKVSLAGIDFNTLEGDESSLGRTFLAELPKTLREFSGRRIFNPWRKYYYLLTEAGRDAYRARDKVWHVAQAVLDHHKQSSQEESTSEVSALLDHIVGKPTYGDDGERMAEIITYLVAGHDTTGYSLAFTLYEVAKQGSEFARRLRLEIKDPKEVHLQQDSLFDRTCKEAMRLWPVAALGPFRVVVDKNGLQINDYDVPYRATVVCPILAIMRTAPGLKNPESFDPDRWLDPAQLPSLRDSYMPFSVGLRNCVGMALAQAELRHVLAAIIQRYDLTLLTDFHPDFFLTLKPVGGLLKAITLNEE